MEQTNLINSTFRKNLDAIQNNVNLEITPEQNVAKILCSKADSKITSYEALNGELRFNGEVCFSVSFVNEMGEFFTVYEKESFNAKLLNENISVNFVPMFKTDVIELKVNSSNNEIKLNSVVETFVSGIFTESVNYYVNNNENIITNSNFVNFNTLKLNDSLSFNFEESFNSKETVNKILFKNADVKILDYSLGTDYFTIEGLITVNIGMETGEENKKLCQYTNTYKFKEELEKEGITKEGYLILNSDVLNCEIGAEIESNEEENKINLSLPIGVNFAYLVPNTAEVVVDAYSLTNKLNLNIESFKIDGKNFVKHFNEKIDGQLVIDDEAPRIIKIIGYCGEGVTITNSFKDDDKLITEGIVSVNVIYLSEEENEILNSVIIKVPFISENKCEEINSEDELITAAIINEIDVKCKKGKEINIDVDLCILVNAFNSIEEMALTSVTEGEELTPKEACLQIYFARKGNSLWDISKGLTCKPEQILEQNPNILLPLENDEKIVYFKSTEK